MLTFSRLAHLSKEWKTCACKFPWLNSGILEQSRQYEGVARTILAYMQCTFIPDGSMCFSSLISTALSKRRATEDHEDLRRKRPRLEFPNDRVPGQFPLLPTLELSQEHVQSAALNQPTTLPLPTPPPSSRIVCAEQSPFSLVCAARTVASTPSTTQSQSIDSTPPTTQSQSIDSTLPTTPSQSIDWIPPTTESQQSPALNHINYEAFEQPVASVRDPNRSYNIQPGTNQSDHGMSSRLRLRERQQQSEEFIPYLLKTPDSSLRHGYLQPHSPTTNLFSIPIVMTSKDSSPTAPECCIHRLYPRLCWLLRICSIISGYISKTLVET